MAYAHSQRGHDSAESREGLREISQSCYASGQALAKPDENGQQRCGSETMDE